MIVFVLEFIFIILMLLASLMLMIKCHRLNMSHSNKSALGFLAPLIYVVVAVLICTTLLLPHALDSVDILTNRLNTVTISVPPAKLVDRSRKIVIPDGRVLRLDTFGYIMLNEGTYKISYTKRTAAVIDMETVEPTQTK